MPNLNRVELMGNMTRDAELKYTPKGTAIADFGLAINRSWKDNDGVKHEKVTFVDIAFWGRLAEIIGEYGGKGKPIYVEGRLELDTWEDKESGKKRSKLKVVGESLQLLGGKPHGSEGTSRRTEAPPQQSAPPPRQYSEPDDYTPF